LDSWIMSLKLYYLLLLNTNEVLMLMQSHDNVNENLYDIKVMKVLMIWIGSSNEILRQLMYILIEMIWKKNWNE